MDNNKDEVAAPCNSVDTHLILSNVGGNRTIDGAHIIPISSVGNTSTEDPNKSSAEHSAIPKPLTATAKYSAGNEKCDTTKPKDGDETAESAQLFQPSDISGQSTEVSATRFEDEDVASRTAAKSLAYNNIDTRESKDSGTFSRVSGDKEANDGNDLSKIIQNEDHETEVINKTHSELPVVDDLLASLPQTSDEDVPSFAVGAQSAQFISQPSSIHQPQREQRDGIGEVTRAIHSESDHVADPHSLRVCFIFIFKKLHDQLLTSQSPQKAPDAPSASLAFRNNPILRFRSQTRSYNGQSGCNNRASDDGQLVRLQAQLARAQNELSIERETKANMRKTIEAEVQTHTDGVINEMLMDLYHKQVSVEKSKLALRHIEIDLEMREAQVKQSEIFLSLGQKFLSSEGEKYGAESFSHLHIDNAREQGRHEGIASCQHSQADFDAQLNSLNLRENKLALLEKNWKAQVSENIEAELRDVLWDDIKKRITTTEYTRGFEHGKEVSHSESVNDAREEGYLEGYHAARREQDTLISFRNGELPIESPALEFLFNPGHPDNPFNRGMQIGRREGSAKLQK
jgi:hypothetical protein